MKIICFGFEEKSVQGKIPLGTDLIISVGKTSDFKTPQDFDQFNIVVLGHLEFREKKRMQDLIANRRGPGFIEGMSKKRYRVPKPLQVRKAETEEELVELFHIFLKDPNLKAHLKPPKDITRRS